MFHSNIPDVLLKESCKTIVKRFSELSLEEIKHSFERIEREKKITISIDDIIKPIEKYFNVKYFISREVKQLRKEEFEAKQTALKEHEFISLSLDLYRKSVLEGKWLGDIYNSSAIAKTYIAPLIDQETKNELWKDAQREYKTIKESDDLFLLNTGATELRLFAQKIVLEGVKRKVSV